MARLLIRGAAHWGGGQPRPCITCGYPALLINDNRDPQHKVCAETEQDGPASPAAAPER